MNETERKELLVDFIVNNKLDFDGGDSSVNSESCILSGYGLHIGVEDIDELEEAIEQAEAIHPGMYYDELVRVFNYAIANDYGAYWVTEQAKRLYKF
jgi:hypothetical protein